MKTSLFITIVIGLAVIGLAALYLVKPDWPEPDPHVNRAGSVHKLVAYKSPTCGCCANWVAIMRIKGYKVEDVSSDKELEAVKEKYNIPESLYSCHTTIVNDGQYYIEGHIPEEAIVKLMEEEPDIKGIGMPGMPSASPGMPGNKLAPFDISKVHENGHITQFMSV